MWGQAICRATQKEALSPDLSTMNWSRFFLRCPLSQTSFPAFGPTWNSSGNPTTPKRDPQSTLLAEPDPKVAKTEGAASAQEDLACAQRRAMGIPASQLITASKEKLNRAGEEPTRECRADSALYPTGNPTQVAHDPVWLSKNSRNLDVQHG